MPARYMTGLFGPDLHEVRFNRRPTGREMMEMNAFLADEATGSTGFYKTTLDWPNRKPHMSFWFDDLNTAIHFKLRFCDN